MFRTLGKLSSKVICQLPPEVLQERRREDHEWADPTDDTTPSDGGDDSSTRNAPHSTKIASSSPRGQQGCFDFVPEWGKLAETTKQQSPTAVASSAMTPETRRRMASSINRLLCHKEQKSCRGGDPLEMTMAQQQTRGLSYTGEEFWFEHRYHLERRTNLLTMAVDGQESADGSSLSSQQHLIPCTSSRENLLKGTISASDQTLDDIAKMSSPYRSRYQQPHDYQKPGADIDVILSQPNDEARIIDLVGMELVLQIPQGCGDPCGYKEDDDWMDDVSSIASASVASREEGQYENHDATLFSLGRGRF